MMGSIVAGWQAWKDAENPAARLEDAMEQTYMIEYSP
jgi:hypothetical protein